MKPLTDLSADRKLLIVSVCIAVFIAAAVISCIVLFVRAGDLAEKGRVMDRAAVEISSVTEALRAGDGDLRAASHLLTSHRAFDISEDSMTLYYDEDFSPSTKSRAAYRAVVRQQDGTGSRSYSIHIFETAKQEDSRTPSPVYELDLRVPDTGGED